MPEKKPAVEIVAKFVKISGVMVFLEEPEKEEYSLPADLKILKVIKDGDKIMPGQSYTWKIVEDAKGQRSILTAGPADQEEGFKPASQIPREDSKAILQKNLDAKKKESQPAPAKPQNVDESIGLPAICQTCVYVHDCPTLKPRENCKVAMGHKLKDDAEGDARLKENAEYAKQLVAEKEAKDKQKAIPAQKAPAVVVTVVEPESVKETASLCVREASPQFDENKIALIRAKCAPNCTPTEFELLMHMADKYKLDPLVRQIWAVKYKDAPAAIFCGRDGFLEIAHRSGQFNGMESGTRMEGDEMIGWCKVWRKDMEHPFYVEVYLKEYQKPIPYSGKPGLWQTMPRVMIQKVAESSALRRAFSVSGLYCPEEMPEQ